jgi:S1-C subfamily serine protease
LPAQVDGQTLTLGGDVILSIHGIRVGEADFHRRMRERGRALGDDDTIELDVLRDGQVIHLEATVGLLFAK